MSDDLIPLTKKQEEEFKQSAVIAGKQSVLLKNLKDTLDQLGGTDIDREYFLMLFDIWRSMQSDNRIAELALKRKAEDIPKLKITTFFFQVFLYNFLNQSLGIGQKQRDIAMKYEGQMRNLVNLLVAYSNSQGLSPYRLPDILEQSKK
jgi:hypothetical protein